MKKVVSNAGYSLVESTVALALMVTVLAPAAGFVVHLTGRHLARQKIEALAIGQKALEKSIATLRFVNQITVDADEKWVVSEEYQVEEDLVTIQISVTRKGSSQPEISLRTARLRPGLDR